MKLFTSHLHRAFAVLTITGFVLTLAGSAGAADKGDPAKLTSFKKCTMCHKKDSIGNQLGIWEKSPHAKAFEVLATPEAKEVATKLGIDNAQTSGKCLKCHSTAYYFSETRQSEEVEVELGVTCQSCHGPGDEYKSKTVHGTDREAAISKGFIYPALEKSCTHCHNKDNPTNNPERYTLADGSKTGFDPKQAFEKIAHPVPEGE